MASCTRHKKIPCTDNKLASLSTYNPHLSNTKGITILLLAAVANLRSLESRTWQGKTIKCLFSSAGQINTTSNTWFVCFLQWIYKDYLFFSFPTAVVRIIQHIYTSTLWQLHKQLLQITQHTSPGQPKSWGKLLKFDKNQFPGDRPVKQRAVIQHGLVTVHMPWWQ